MSSYIKKLKIFQGKKSKINSKTQFTKKKEATENVELVELDSSSRLEVLSRSLQIIRRYISPLDYYSNSKLTNGIAGFIFVYAEICPKKKKKDIIRDMQYPQE